MILLRLARIGGPIYCRQFSVRPIKVLPSPSVATRTTHPYIGSTMADAPRAELPDKISFPAEEERILELWRKLDAFNKSLELSKGKPEVWEVLTSCHGG